jgi:hypothetical protein
MLGHKIAYGRLFLTHYQTLGLEENCSKFCILVTSHQIFVFAICGLGGHICKQIE